MSGRQHARTVSPFLVLNDKGEAVVTRPVLASVFAFAVAIAGTASLAAAERTRATDTEP